MSETSVTINMKFITHNCGTIYAIPNWVYQYQCPVCARKSIERADQKVDKYKKSNATLRGIVTKLKRKGE